mgnify:CR=1 FL=1
MARFGHGTASNARQGKSKEKLLNKKLAEKGFLLEPLLAAKRLDAIQFTKAPKGALAKGAKSKSSDKPQFLMWVLHYLRRRDGQRARYFQAQLPMRREQAQNHTSSQTAGSSIISL